MGRGRTIHYRPGRRNLPGLNYCGPERSVAVVMASRLLRKRITARGQLWRRPFFFPRCLGEMICEGRFREWSGSLRVAMSGPEINWGRNIRARGARSVNLLSTVVRNQMKVRGSLVERKKPARAGGTCTHIP